MLLTEAVETKGAVCLDGSPGAVYVRPGSYSACLMPNITMTQQCLKLHMHNEISMHSRYVSCFDVAGAEKAKWHVHFEGGGWCFHDPPSLVEDDQCHYRAYVV